MDPAKKQAGIIWLTGMSGSGKSTFSKYLEVFFEKHGCSTKILDGDAIRKNDDKKLGFSYKDVKENNLRIAALCQEARGKFDYIIVPVISPYEEVRKEVRNFLSPRFYLIFLKACIKFKLFPLVEIGIKISPAVPIEDNSREKIFS